jgi:hypothetical protein
VRGEIKRLRLIGIGGAAVLVVFFTALGLNAASIASPALRAYAFGTAVSIAEVQEALCKLDEMLDLPAIPQVGSSGGSA